jgi:hypothetical protein
MGEVGKSANVKVVQSTVVGGEKRNTKLIRSPGLFFPSPLSCTANTPVNPSRPVGSLIVTTPLATAVFPTTDRQLIAMCIFCPEDRLLSWASPLTLPSCCVIAVNEKVRSSPTTVRLPWPDADGPLSGAAAVGCKKTNRASTIASAKNLNVLIWFPLARSFITSVSPHVAQRG